ncbi:MAG TPA: N-acetylmuramoyl-L-alanine amidase [Candidatus Saccharimonadia bacterium]|nr:N-acetylmuramoyl-L-alanine amidase [Candidatus Saccharimonadia bacterium]
MLAATALACALPAAAQNVVAVRVWESPDSTRAVFDLSGPVDYKVFALEGPNRLVVDLRDGALGGDFAPPPAKGLIRGLRTGKPTPRELRIVIDLAEGVRPKSFLLPPAERFGHRLVIDLYPRGGTPAVVKSAPAKVQPGAQRDVVVAIDAGHGGEDPGALGAIGTREKDVTLAIAKALKQQIDAEPGMSAILVREGDYYIAHKKRYEKARSNKADLFVSIHADAFTKRSAAGSSVYMLSQRGATSEAARFLAQKENPSDLVGGVSLNDKDGTLAAVLLDLSQGATLASSDIVATQVLTSLKRLGRVHSNQVQRANFMVLRAPDVPSILVETGFISNPGEEKLLRDPAHRKKIAAAILGGVRSYFHTMPPPGTWIASNRRAPTEHVVARGESLSLIAQRHGTTVARLRDVNKLRNDTVQVGAVLRIPTSS